MNRPIFKYDFFQDMDPNEIPWNKLAEALNRPEEYQDEEGFKIRIWGGDIHPTKNWIAWIDLHERTTNRWIEDRYYLRIQIAGKQVFEWEVETYNPAFGAVTLYLHWHDEKAVYIYSEKHRYYGVTATMNGIQHRIELAVVSSPIYIDGNLVTFMDYSKTYNGYLNQYRLPDWQLLDPLPEAKAREMGLLEDEEI